MTKTELMRELQKYELAERQAGPGASDEEIRKFYLHPFLADSVGKHCSLEVFEFLSRRSQDCQEFVEVEPKMNDFGLEIDHFRELSELKMRSGIIVRVMGALFGVGTILKRSQHLQKSISYARALRAYERSFLPFWRNLTWREFETEVENLFRRIGFRSSTTPATGDSGVDVTLLNETGCKIIVQCKHHAKPIGPSVVREMLGTIVREKASSGIIVALSGFTQGAYNTARDSVTLLEIEDLINLTKGNFALSLGEVPFRDPRVSGTKEIH